MCTVQSIYTITIYKICELCTDVLRVHALVIYPIRLYTPTTHWQRGQTWTTSLHPSITSGIQQHLIVRRCNQLCTDLSQEQTHRNNPKKNSSPTSSQVNNPVSYLKVVTISCWQDVQRIWTGTSPNLRLLITCWCWEEEQVISGKTKKISLCDSMHKLFYTLHYSTSYM